MKYRTYQRSVFQVGIGEGYFWFRVFGLGLHVKDLGQHSLGFSERQGFTKQLTVFGYSIKALCK
jgi:hypothetical protein